MIIKLVYNGASGSDILSDFKKIILGTVSTTTTSGIVKPSNLNASSSESIIYGSLYTNPNSKWSNPNSNDYYVKNHHFYSGNQNWISFTIQSNNLFLECGKDPSDLNSKKTGAITTSIPMGSSVTETYYVVITDKIFYIGSTISGTYRQGFFSDVAKNATDNIFTDGSLMVMNCGGTIENYLPYYYDAGFKKYITSTQSSDNPWLFSQAAGASLADKKIHYLFLGGVEVGLRNLGLWHVYGISSRYVIPTYRDMSILYDSSGNPYLLTMEKLYSGVTKNSVSDFSVEPNNNITGTYLTIEG